MESTLFKPWKAVALGALSGAMVFFALRAATADPPSVNVHDLHLDVKSYVGKQVTVTGIVHNVNHPSYKKHGQGVPYTTLSLYETDLKTSNRGKYYVFISVPSSELRFQPNEGDNIGVTGTLAWANMIAQIED